MNENEQLKSAIEDLRVSSHRFKPFEAITHFVAVHYFFKWHESKTYYSFRMDHPFHFFIFLFYDFSSFIFLLVI